MPHLILLFFSLISFTASYQSVPSSEIQLQIRNKLSLYSLAVDRKDSSLYQQIFVQDVTANYYFPQFQSVTNLASLEKYESDSVDMFAGTQYSITSTVIEQDAGSTGINSTAYFIGSCFGKDKNKGKSAQVIGYYVDQWETTSKAEDRRSEQHNTEKEPEYLIKKRDVFYVGVTGDPTTLAPQ